MERIITKLTIWDFDGTLISTPLPEEGKKIYKQKTGKDWPHAGWWGRADSLDMSIFDMPVIKSVIADYNKEKSNPDTMTVMLTGRMVKLGDLVRKILADKNLTFDEYHFNRGGSTDVAKIKTMEDILLRVNTIKEISIYDDRSEHIDIFKKWCENQVETGRLQSFKIFHIINGIPTLI
jgi:hypothetical protein